MAIAVPNKYALKALHEEIALFDRKLAHLQKYETFSSEKDRLAAAAKMSVKRSQLVRAAQAMTDAGIEFTPADVSISARETEDAVDNSAASVLPAAAALQTVHTLEPSHQGSVLDFRNSIGEYKKRRKLMA